MFLTLSSKAIEAFILARILSEFKIQIVKYIYIILAENGGVVKYFKVYLIILRNLVIYIYIFSNFIVMNWFLKDNAPFYESHKTKDLLWLDNLLNEFINKLEKSTFTNDKIIQNPMIWLKWRFWIWKSTFLYKLEEEIKAEKNKKFFEFDAWKYPDRANLWESFVLELAKSIDEKNFNKTIRKIDWEIPWFGKFAGFTAGVLWNISNFSDFFNTSPAKRTFEVQCILLDLINRIWEQTLYIVIEDIDRSWDSWIYFLETLNYFIKNSNIEKYIKVIVPISNKSYQDNSFAYHKCFDYIEDFILPEYALENFCGELFIDEIVNNENKFSLLVDFLNNLLVQYSEDFTLREIKLVIRNANNRYINVQEKIKNYLWDNFNENIHKPDFLMCIIVEAMKIAKIISPISTRSIYDDLKTNNFRNIESSHHDNKTLFRDVINSINSNKNVVWDSNKSNRSDLNPYYQVLISNDFYLRFHSATVKNFILALDKKINIARFYFE